MEKVIRELKMAIPPLKRLIKAHKKAGREKMATYSEGELKAFEGILKLIKHYQKREGE